MSPPDAFNELIDSLFERLERSFRAHGWLVQRAVGGGPAGYQADFLIEKTGARYVVELRVARQARSPELPALLADAFLRAQVGAHAHGALPLAVVGAPKVSARWARALREHADRFFPGTAWGFIDGTGRMELHGRGIDLSSAPAPEPRVSRAARGRSDAFSDLGQWMAKVLLAPTLPEKYLHARRNPIAGPSSLAAASGVSVPTASRFLARLGELGFLDPSGRTIVRRDEFLADWRAANRFTGVERSCQLLLPAPEPVEALCAAIAARPAGAPRACLGLFSACERLGLGFVRGAPTHLYLEQASDAALEQLGLVAVRPGERVDVFVREPRFPEAVFRGAVVAGGVPAADALQCWLDVRDHPVRGAEQAAQVWSRVLQPHLDLGEPR